MTVTQARGNERNLKTTSVQLLVDIWNILYSTVAEARLEIISSILCLDLSMIRIRKSNLRNGFILEQKSSTEEKPPPGRVSGNHGGSGLFSD